MGASSNAWRKLEHWECQDITSNKESVEVSSLIKKEILLKF